MRTVRLDTPTGISARFGWDPGTSPHDRRRLLAREAVAEHAGVGPEAVRVEREEPSRFGYHTRLVATVHGRESALAITTTSFRAATVVAVADAALAVGVDLRDGTPDAPTWRDIRRHSHLWTGTDESGYLAHWCAVQAVLAADARGERVMPDRVLLEDGLARGWVTDRPERYRLRDVSRAGFLMTLAFGPRLT
jgi:4'-phosphopantetheinyl transferase